MNSVADHPQQVFNAFIQFEREEGTMEQLEKALAKVFNDYGSVIRSIDPNEENETSNY